MQHMQQHGNTKLICVLVKSKLIEFTYTEHSV